jgi:hypothetical protein
MWNFRKLGKLKMVFASTFFILLTGCNAQLADVPLQTGQCPLLQNVLEQLSSQDIKFSGQCVNGLFTGTNGEQYPTAFRGQIQFSSSVENQVQVSSGQETTFQLNPVYLNDSDCAWAQSELSEVQLAQPNGTQMTYTAKCFSGSFTGPDGNSYNSSLNAVIDITCPSCTVVRPMP